LAAEEGKSVSESNFGQPWLALSQEIGKFDSDTDFPGILPP
jgi:hypothetical protein